MLPTKDRIAVELKKAKTIWKDLVNNHKSDETRVSEIFTRYKKFLEENQHLISGEYEPLREISLIEEKLSHYYGISGKREKRILLNDAYVGLVFNISETIDELKSKMEEKAYAASEQVFLN